MSANIDSEAMAMPENLRGYLSIAAVLMATDRILHLAVVERLRGSGTTDDLGSSLHVLREQGVLDDDDVAAVWRVRDLSETVRSELADVHLRWIGHLEFGVFRDAYRVLEKCGKHWIRLTAESMGPDELDPEAALDAHAVLLLRLCEAAGLA